MASRFPRELTLRQLRALAAVHSDRSVTAAAKRLHLTQPAVTLQIRNLQALAGLPLIQRTGEGMLLTDAGREVLALSERIEAAITDCETSLEMMAGKTAGRISIGAVSTAKYFVPFMISGFSKLYPNVDVTLSIGNRQEIGTALRGYDLDFAIMGRPPADIDMDVHLIGDHPTSSLRRLAIAWRGSRPYGRGGETLNFLPSAARPLAAGCGVEDDELEK